MCEIRANTDKQECKDKDGILQVGLNDNNRINSRIEKLQNQFELFKNNNTSLKLNQKENTAFNSNKVNNQPPQSPIRYQPDKLPRCDSSLNLTAQSSRSHNGNESSTDTGHTVNKENNNKTEEVIANNYKEDSYDQHEQESLKSYHNESSKDNTEIDLKVDIRLNSG